MRRRTIIAYLLASQEAANLPEVLGGIKANLLSMAQEEARTRYKRIKDVVPVKFYAETVDTVNLIPLPAEEWKVRFILKADVLYW